MKFILNKDTLKIENADLINSGSVNYYEADVEYDESWNDLTIKAVLIKNGEEEGKEIAVIGNKIFLDKEEFGSHCIGFVGYTIEDEEKVYQISTNLESFYIQKGAGEVETEQEQIPTPTEWEKYITQIEEMLKNAGGDSGGITEETDPTVPQHVKDITEEDIVNWNNVDELENVLQNILEAIQNGVSASMTIKEIEQLIVSYFENKTVEEVEG